MKKRQFSADSDDSDQAPSHKLNKHTVTPESESLVKRGRGVQSTVHAVAQRSNQVDVQDVSVGAIVNVTEDMEDEIDGVKKYQKDKATRDAVSKGDLEAGVYRGIAAYNRGVEPSEHKLMSAKSTGALGPIKTMKNMNVTSRFDYQADICKDFKETGYCGFGDSCKFLHDRSDYKSGWEIDAELKAASNKLNHPSGTTSLDQQFEVQLKADQAWQAFRKRHDEEESEVKATDLPDTCSVCGTVWSECSSSACKSQCGHYFCEGCFVKQCMKKCAVCKKPTGGVLLGAPELAKK